MTTLINSYLLPGKDFFKNVLTAIPETMLNVKPSKETVRWLIITSERKDAAVLPPISVTSLERRKLTLEEYCIQLEPIILSFCNIFADQYKIRYPLAIEVDEVMLCNIIKDIETSPTDKVDFLYSVLESESGERKKQILLFLIVLYSVYPVILQAIFCFNGQEIQFN
jgi:hypothetical protein